MSDLGASRRDRVFPGDRAVGRIVVGALCLATVLPLLLMVSLALQTDSDIYSGSPVLVPSAPQWENFATLFERAPIARFFLNSFLVATAITLAHLLFDTMAGYVFAKFDFPFKRTIFILVLSTLMIPFFVRVIPLYRMFADVQWLDSYQALILPFLVDAYGIFLMRQFIAPLPDELAEAARVDGASEIRIFFRVIMPQVKPALAVLGLFTFVYQLNNFLWPLVATSSTEMRTLPIGLTLFSQENHTDWHLIAAGSVLLFLPTAALFIFAQRYLVKGISLSGLK